MSNVTANLISAADYAAASIADKAAARAAADAAVRDALKAGDLAGAQAAMALRESYAPAAAPKVEVNYGQLVAVRVASLRRAADLIESGQVRPAGVPDDADLTPEPLSAVETATVADLAQTMAAHKVARSVPTGPRSNVGAAIESWAASVEPGTFGSAGDIARAMDLPSSGAVAARLFPRSGEACNVPGVTPVTPAQGFPAQGAVAGSWTPEA